MIDMVVVGAGVAGIGAARRLADASVAALLVVARPYAGGRARTASELAALLDTS